MVKKFILIGHSHTYALRAGFQHLGVRDEDCLYCFVPKLEQEVLAENAQADLVSVIGDRVRDTCATWLGLEHADQLAEKIAADDVEILLSLGGNEHNIIGLIRTAEQYDFVLPALPDLRVEDAKIIPLDAVYLRVTQSLTYIQNLASVFKKIFGSHLQAQAPPPPIGDNSYIYQHLDAYFIQTYGDQVAINDPLFRYKIFHLREMAMQHHFASLGIAYGASPAELVAAGRYLDPDAYGEDATHANARFGVAALRNLYPTYFGDVRDEA